MKKLNFVSTICVICSLFTFTIAWSQTGPLDIEPLRQISGSTANGNSGTTGNLPSDPLIGDRGLSSLIDVSSTLEGLSATEFADSNLTDIAKTEIETYCRENNIAIEKVISVIESFDNELQANAHGAQSRALAPLTDPSQPTIVISSDSDAKDFARLMTQITDELVQEDVFRGNELMNSNMVMPAYTLPIGRIAYKHPEVKGTNLLLGALDFQLNVNNLEKIGGVEGYNIWDIDTGLLMALSEHVDERSDWKDAVGLRAGTVGYQAAIEGLNALYSEYGGVPITIGSAEEMEDFAELIDVATTAYNRPMSGFHLQPFESFWGEVIREVQSQGGLLEYRTITDYIEQMKTIK